MSLRTNNKCLPVLSPTDRQTVPLRGIRPAAAAVAKPNGEGLKLLEKIVATQTPSNDGIGFIIDATDSRTETWAEAQEIQSQMFFSYGNALRLRLIHFGGNELSVHPWEKSKDVLAMKMAAVKCVGGQTQIVEALNVFTEETGAPPKSLIVVGDSFEEKFEALSGAAHQLAQKSIRVYAFQEGADSEAKRAFKHLAKTTRGAYAKFGQDLLLGDLCEGAVLMTLGGTAALRSLQNEAARKALLLQLTA